MNRCPKCRSRKWRENQLEKGKWKCFKCGFEWWDPRYHKPIPTNEQRYGGVNGNAIPLIDYHNIVYKFPIIKDNPNVHLPNQKQMRGWIQEWETIKQAKIQRTPKHVIIFLNKRIKKTFKETDNLDEEILTYIMKIAENFQKKYNIILGKPQPLRKEVKLLEGFRSPVQFHGKKIKCVYSDGRIEFIDPEKAIIHTKNFIENMALETKSDLIIKTIDGGFNTLHYLLSQQNEIISKQTDILKSIANRKSLFQNIIGWILAKVIK